MPQSKELAAYRKELKKDGKNICYAELCGIKGTVKNLEEFSGKSTVCNLCTERKNYRKDLKKDGKNICYGQLCNGIVYNIDMFYKKTDKCKKCHDKTVSIFLEKNGRPENRTKNQYKNGKSCVHCGENDIRFLEFDHIEEKTITIASSSSKKIITEIEKTQLLCIWCHRIKTYNERDRVSSIEDMIKKYSYDENYDIKNGEDVKKCSGPLCLGVFRGISMFFIRKNRNSYVYNNICKKCNNYKNREFFLKAKKHVIYRKLEIGGCNHCDKKVTNENFMCFDFDHLRDKISDISQLMTCVGDIKKIDEEIAKCQLLCCNCHKIKTIEQLGWKYFI
jgi:hypothetical protein